MPENCRVCNHPDKLEIEKHIITGSLSLRAISRKYEGISYSGLRSHKANHLAEVMEAVKEKRKADTVALATDTLSILDQIIAQTPKVLDQANLSTVIKALELRAKITGEADQTPILKIEWGLALEKDHIRKVDHVRYKVLEALEDAGEDLSAPNLPDIPGLNIDLKDGEDQYDKEIEDYMRRRDAGVPDSE